MKVKRLNAMLVVFVLVGGHRGDRGCAREHPQKTTTITFWDAYSPAARRCSTSRR